MPRVIDGGGSDEWSEAVIKPITTISLDSRNNGFYSVFIYRGNRNCNYYGHLTLAQFRRWQRAQAALMERAQKEKGEHDPR